MSAVKRGVEAYLLVRENSNSAFRKEACTYGELKVAVNSAAYVLREAFGDKAFDAELERADCIPPTNTIG